MLSPSAEWWWTDARRTLAAPLRIMLVQWCRYYVTAARLKSRHPARRAPE
jgi:hypothetical protein